MRAIREPVNSGDVPMVRASVAIQGKLAFECRATMACERGLEIADRLALLPQGQRSCSWRVAYIANQVSCTLGIRSYKAAPISQIEGCLIITLCHPSQVENQSAMISKGARRMSLIDIRSLANLTNECGARSSYTLRSSQSGKKVRLPIHGIVVFACSSAEDGNDIRM